MRKKYLFIILLLSAFMATNSFSQTVKYSAGNNQGIVLEQEQGNKLLIKHSISQFSFTDIDVEGEAMKAISLSGAFLPNNEGAPDLPGLSRYIAIPQGAKVTIRILNANTEEISQIEIAPAPKIPLDTDNSPLKYEKNMNLYSQNQFYPANPVMISEPSKIRGMDVVLIGITPFQYNPVTKKLIVYKDLEIEVDIDGGTQIGESRLRSRWWDPILKDAVLNPSIIPEVDYSQSIEGSKTLDYEYLIICPDDPIFISWADSVALWRNLQGIHSGVVTITEVGGNTTAAIESYVNNAYNTWAVPPAAVLLLGDYGTSGSTIVSPIYNSYCASDNIYADVDGDQLPDITFARMTAQNATHLETMITKFLDYERNPPTNPNFYDHPITALGWQTERWFQICSETVGGFWRNELGKDPVRINEVYSGSPGSTWSTATNTSTVVNYFGPSGLGYIPAQPSTLGGWTGGSAADITNAVNSGAFMLQHRDHGGTTGWGEPSFNSSNINSLTNTDLTWIFSINCLTGKYNISGECFAEKFHRHTSGGHNAGALGITAASESSYSFVNDTYVWGMYDNMWTDFMPAYGTNPASRGVLPAFANVAGKIFLSQSSWPYNTSSKEVTYHLFHHHGDAFTTVYSEVPQYLTVNHSAALLSGNTSFTVTADANSFIALTVNGHIIGTADGTGSPVAITIPAQNPGETMIVTVTKQNYYRYSSAVDIIPPTGPFVNYNTYTINDAAGNNNGEADFGESILLNMTLENIGSAMANNVHATLICADPYINITDNSGNFGSIASSSTTTLNNAFAFTLATDIPDQYMLNFELQVTGTAKDTWTSYFSIVVNAPVLAVGSLTVDDSGLGNNNGKLDPGEISDLIIETSNTGHSDSPIATATLSTTSPFISITTNVYNFGNIAISSTENAQFEITVDAATPTGTLVSFEYNVVAGNYSDTKIFNVVVGHIPVLILNLDDNTNSSAKMEAALTSLSVPYEIYTSFPADLSLYQSVFICLGIYSGNHVLSSTEGSLLETYLNDGGNLYMEGGDTWAYDAQTAVHSMFNIVGEADGTSDMGTVLGQGGTFTDGMSFNYSGANSYIDHLAATAPAFVIFENNSPIYGTGVAYDAGTYRTIGTSHEFGGLDDAASPSTKVELMEQYLLFFGIGGNLPAPADISVNPGSFHVYLAPDQSTHKTLTISNSGEADLNYNIAVDNISKGGKMNQVIAPKICQSMRNKEYFANQYIEEEVVENPVGAWVMPPIKKYAEDESKGEETFGSWSGGTWTGGNRDRGNFYHITSDVKLDEFRFYLNISSSMELYFVVYEGDALEGTYTKIAETHIASSGTGEGWYSSGSINANLLSGKYYYLGTSWNGTATYGRGNDVVPIPTSFGTLESGNPSTIAGFPPAATVSNSYIDITPYYQTVVTSAFLPEWLIPNSLTGNISGGGSDQIDVLFDATGLTEGVYVKNLNISSNDPNEPTVIVPCTLEVHAPTVVDAKAFLQGPFFSTQMNTLLNVFDYIPLNQPFNTAPWNYSGTENVAAIPNADVVDWILVELRETSGDVTTASSATIIAQQAGFILKDGSIVSLDGISPLSFSTEITMNLYLVIHHRNHASIISSSALTESGGLYSYDFTNSVNKVYGGVDAHVELSAGVWGMFSGNALSDTQIDNKDKNDVWEVEKGNAGYYNGDMNMDGQVDSTDEDVIWENNAGKSSKVPE